MTTKDSNKLLQGWSLAILAFLLFVLYSFAYDNIPFLQQNFKPINVLSFLQAPAARNVVVAEELDENDVFQVAIDTTSLVDSVALRIQEKKDSIEALRNYTGVEHLNLFFTSLKKTENKEGGSTRIGYYGDSMIEGDLMSKSLRQRMQKTYGGMGIGFMPVTSIAPGFRVNIGHSFSDNWVYSSLVNGNKTDFPFGLSGEIFSVDSGDISAWVKYTAKYSTFPVAKLFYGAVDSIQDTLNTVTYLGQKFSLAENNTVNTITLSNQSLEEIKLDFSFHYPQPIYGVSFESNSGVLVDNFASRGSSGLPLTSIRNSTLSSFNKNMDYDLIILQFGINTLTSNSNYSWYKSGMKNVVSHLKNAIPTASILIVSVADKSAKNDNGEMETDEAITPLVKAQKEVAIETGVAFFNLYEAMGGENSMVKWVDELGYANKDYTHFNFKGADAASQLIYDFLVEEFENTKNLNENNGNE